MPSGVWPIGRDYQAVRTRPVIVQHYAGEPGAGGPATAVERLLVSRLSARYQFVPMHQANGNGAIDVRLLGEWVRLLRRVRPDVVHVRGLQNEGLHGVLAARIARCPRVMLTVHGTVRDLQRAPRSLRRLLLKRCAEPATLRAATHVATVCEYAAGRSFLRPVARKFLGVVPNGVPLPDDPAAVRARARAENGMRDDDLVMITVSRLTWEKGYATLARSVASLPPCGPRPVLLVVGDGPDRAGIEAAFPPNAGMDVRFLGQRLDVSVLLSSADVFVFPTLHENLSLALLEAMAHGLPVVASAVGGNVEVLSRGGGILVPPGDAAALSAAVARLLVDDATRRWMGRAARRVVAEYYSQDTMLSVLDAMYQRVLWTGRR